MLITGTERKEVEVEVTSSEMLLCLLSQYGYIATNLLERRRDTRSKLVKRDGKYFLEYYEDVSYHGSPSYVKENEKELSKEEYTAIECILYLYDLEMKKKDEERKKKR